MPMENFYKIGLQAFPTNLPKKERIREIAARNSKKNIEKKSKHFPLQENAKKATKITNKKTILFLKQCRVLDQGGIWFPNEEDS